jgi:hypothetical protein
VCGIVTAAVATASVVVFLWFEAPTRRTPSEVLNALFGTAVGSAHLAILAMVGWLVGSGWSKRVVR